MKTGMVLEGGAMRGMFTAGVLDVLNEAQVEIDEITGVSAGALFGVNFVSGQNGRVIRYNKRFNGDSHYMGLRPLIKEGNIVSTKMAYEEVPRRLDPFDNEAFKRSKTSFYAVVTDVYTGEPAYIRIEDVFEQMDTLRASGSMPFVSRPVQIGSRLYLDGGIADSIPFEWELSRNCDKLLVILTRENSYRKQAMSQAAVRLYARRYPKLAQRLKDRHTAYNSAVEKLQQLESAGTVFVIRPSQPIHMKRMESDPDKLQAVYDLGRSDALASLSALKKYLCT